MANASLVIMAAGLGSRYGGNKQIDGVGPHGEFLMQYSVYDAVRAGFDKVVFIAKPDIHELIHTMCGAMVEKLRTPDGRSVEVCYADQTYDELPAFYTVPAGRTKPFGTCHAVLCAKDDIAEPFCVINADDYYGVDAYRTIYAALMDLRPDTACMVGYLLKNTVSEHGTVCRGVCKTENGCLSAIRETKKIALTADGTITDVERDAVLDGEGIVSMNFWGFSPAVLEDMERYMEDFLHQNGDDLTAECLLPTMVGELVDAGKLTVEVLSSKDRWFGMTYHEDKAIVAAELQKLHDAGVYPEKLA